MPLQKIKLVHKIYCNEVNLWQKIIFILNYVVMKV